MLKSINPPVLSTADKLAIIAAVIKMESFLKVIVPVYLQASVDNRDLLRQHNPTLDKFIILLNNCGVYL